MVQHTGKKTENCCCTPVIPASTNADLPGCRVDQLLSERRGPLPAHERAPATSATPALPMAKKGSGGGNSPADAPGACPEQRAQQRLLRQVSELGSGEVGARYCLAEHYLRALTPVSGGVLLGGLGALADAACLRDARVTHAVLLCCGPEVRPLLAALCSSCTAQGAVHAAAFRIHHAARHEACACRICCFYWSEVHFGAQAVGIACCACDRTEIHNGFLTCLACEAWLSTDQ